MRRRKVIIVLIISVLVGIGVVAFWPGGRVPKEPEYHGKKLREWLRVVEKNSIADHEVINDSTNLDNITNESPQVIEAVRAVRAIGTNALPYLVKWNIEQPRWRILPIPTIRNVPNLSTAPQLRIGFTARIQLYLVCRESGSRLWGQTRFTLCRSW